MIKIFTLLVLSLLGIGPSALAEGVSFPEGLQEWDFRHVSLNAIPDEWRPRALKYTVHLPNGIPRDPYVDFSGGLGAARERGVVHTVVRSVTSDADKKALQSAFDPTGGTPLEKLSVNVFTFSVEKATELEGPGLVANLFTWILGSTKPSIDARQSSEAFSQLVAIGGEVVAEERVVDVQGQPFLRLAWFYRVNVGREMRVVPIAFQYLPAR
jgi:hypothetical protein